MAGPKARITAPDLEFEGYPEDRAARRLQFVSEFVVTPRGHGARQPFKVRDFQQGVVRGAFAPGIRQALVSVARGNGKTGLAAALGLAELFVGPFSAEVLVVASDERQARITFDQVRRMVELNPELADRVHLYQDKIVFPQNDATLRPLPADYAALQGWDPSLTIVDELHVVTPEVWEAVTSAAGKRPDSLVLAISTPGTSKESVMWRLVEHGRRGDDPSFWLREFAAPEGCDADDEAAWLAGNPAMSDPDPFLDVEAMRAVRRTISEPRFRQLRLGQWVGQVDTWLPFGAWDGLADTRPLLPGERVTIGFDGSASGDSTALVACIVGPVPHVAVLGVWERPEHVRDWRVPRSEVDAAVRAAFAQYDVVELACDPWGYRSEIQTWANDFGERRVLEYNTGYRKRMGPATDRMYQAVMENAFTHDGNERLAAHVANAIATVTPQGTIISKDARNSKRKIDLAVAAIVAFDRAAWHHSQKNRRRVASFA